MADTTNLILPLMSASQSQKHLTHNDAIIKLDAIVQLAVISMSLTAPPAAVEGDRYIIGSGATGAWAGKDLNVTFYTNGAWVFLIPREGWLIWDEATADIYVWTGATWDSYAAAAGTLTAANLSDGTTVTLLGIAATPDSTNRLSVKSPSVLFNAETDDINITMNKDSASDDARLTFQTGFSTRALFGLLGDDNFTVKVSPDGSTFYDAIKVAASNGTMTSKKPTFSANKNSVDQTGIASTTFTKVTFTNEVNDLGDYYDDTLSRFTPPAGTVHLIAGVYATGLTAGGICTLAVFKNGAAANQKIYAAAATGVVGMDVGIVDTCNGTDYYEIFVYGTTGTTFSINGIPINSYIKGTVL